MIIGERNRFAIQFELDASSRVPYGMCYLWVDGNILGDPGDKIFFTSVADDLMGRVPKKNPKDFDVENGKSLWESLVNYRDSFDWKYTILVVEGFDGFEVFLFQSESGVYVLVWKDKDACVPVISQIDREYFDEVVTEFNRFVYSVFPD